MKLDRTKAIDFAKNHWNTEADDGVFWLSNAEVNVERKRKELKAPSAAGWKFQFVPDGLGGEKAVFKLTGQPDILVHEWAGLADCAHFLSRCLHAGGCPVSSLEVGHLVHLLQDRPDTRTLAEKVDRAQGQNIIDSPIFQPGDMIGYFNIDPHGDYNGKRQYSHSAMYAQSKPDGRITCHTKCRFPGLTPSGFSDLWHLDDTAWLYTFIHFSDDDAPRSTAYPDLLGWWEVSGIGMPTVYQLVEAGGVSRFTLTAPRSAADRPAAQERSYWFVTGVRTYTFTWRNTGTVDTWSPPLTGGPLTGGPVGGFDVLTSGGVRRSAKRLF